MNTSKLKTRIGAHLRSTILGVTVCAGALACDDGEGGAPFRPTDDAVTISVIFWVGWGIGAETGQMPAFLYSPEFRARMLAGLDDRGDHRVGVSNDAAPDLISESAASVCALPGVSKGPACDEDECGVNTGNAGHPCCEGGVCFSADVECSNGTCRPCGGDGKGCCEGGGYNHGLACRALTNRTPGNAEVCR